MNNNVSKDVLKILAKSHKAKNYLVGVLDPDRVESVILMLTAGDITGTIEEEIYDLLADEIHDQASIEWKGYTYDPDDEDNVDRIYPIYVNNYEGVYFVSSIDYEDTGYFTKYEDAMDFVYSNWECVKSDD